MKTRRTFVVSTLAAGATLISLDNKTVATAAGQAGDQPRTGRAIFPDQQAHNRGQDMKDRAEDPKITRARLSGPEHVTRDATVAEFGVGGTLNILVKGSNHWVCVPGDENKIGEPPMCMNPMGMQWMMDAMQGKPRPTNSAPGMIYMLCGATQRSNTDPSDKTSPAIPIGPHWMITWPFDAETNGLPTTVRDKGAWVMFAGTPYSYLHVCGTPWDGNEYREGDKAVWTMSYARP
jgi:hypothetical protein